MWLAILVVNLKYTGYQAYAANDAQYQLDNLHIVIRTGWFETSELETSDHWSAPENQCTDTSDYWKGNHYSDDNSNQWISDSLVSLVFYHFVFQIHYIITDIISDVVYISLYILGSKW